MARDPDTLEEHATTVDSAHQEPGMEFTAGPSRAERTMPRDRRTTPVWPWLVLVMLGAAAVLIYLAVQ